MKKLVTPLFQRCPSLESLQKRNTKVQETFLCRLAYTAACRYGLEKCIEQALRFSSVKDSERVAVDYRDIIYCTNIEFGNEMQFELMMQRFQNTTIESRKSALATGLGCSRNFTQLQQFLDYLLLSTETTTGYYYVEAVTSALHRKYVALETTEHILQHATILK